MAKTKHLLLSIKHINHKLLIINQIITLQTINKSIKRQTFKVLHQLISYLILLLYRILQHFGF